MSHRVRTFFSLLVAGIVLSACQPVRPASDLSPAPALIEQALSWGKLSTDMKIANAMSGGPMAISKDATIIDWPSEASNNEWVVLRTGREPFGRGWTCITDDWGIGYNSPINDPMCVDATWLQWIKDGWAGKEPNVTAPGIAYMYQGSASPDNDTPILAPSEGKDWQLDPPHVMVVFPKGSDLSGIPSDMMMGAPYVMYRGYPNVHVMMPIVVESITPIDPSDRIANAMSAAPTEISAGATIIDWPTDGTANFSLLRQGTNGWTCLPDDNILETATPTNDPLCIDEVWLDWIKAGFEGREPNVTRPGIGYMLQGGSVAHNEDPTMMAPPEGGEWQIDPPHIMILNPGGFDENAWSHDHANGGPYIMYGGTSLEHLMIPVDPVVIGVRSHKH